MKGKQSAIHMKGYTPQCARRAATMVRGKLQHALNPLHVYCRLAEAGASKPKARSLCTFYGKGYNFVLGS